MGIVTYFKSKEILYKDYEFEAIIMAAMRQADSDNLDKLKAAFPETWEELHTRYNSPGGVIHKSEVKYAARQLKVKESEFHNIPD